MNAAFRYVLTAATAFASLGASVGLAPAGGRAQEPALVFAEDFSADLDARWSWLREQPARWCVRNGSLEIRVMPGLAETVENALLREFPARGDDPYAVEVTITHLQRPAHQYEQAGLTWYADGRPVFKLVKELVDGEIQIVPGHHPVDGDTVQLRLEVTGTQYAAWYRTDPDQPFNSAASGDLARGTIEQISLQCYHGPEDAERWVRFDDFRILKLQ